MQPLPKNSLPVILDLQRNVHYFNDRNKHQEVGVEKKKVTYCREDKEVSVEKTRK